MTCMQGKVDQSSPMQRQLLLFGCLYWTNSAVLWTYLGVWALELGYAFGGAYLAEMNKGNSTLHYDIKTQQALGKKVNSPFPCPSSGGGGGAVGGVGGFILQLCFLLQVQPVGNKEEERNKQHYQNRQECHWGNVTGAANAKTKNLLFLSYGGWTTYT